MRSANLLKWLLPAGLAAASLILWKDLLDAEQTIRFLYLTVFGAGILVYVWVSDPGRLARVLPEIISWKNPVFLCIIVWLAATVFSLNSAIQKSEGYVETARVAFFLFTYVWVSACFRSDSKNVIYTSIGFCIIGFILSIIGIADFYNALAKITFDDSYYEMGNMGNRNLLAIMVSLCLPFHFIVFEYYKSPIVRAALSLNFLLNIAGVILTSSRVGWVGLVMLFFVGGVIFLSACFRGFIEKKLIGKLAIAFLALVIAAAVPLSVLLLKNPVAAEITRQRIKSFTDFRSEKNIHTESINERLQIWKSSLQLIKEHPLTGVGAGNWKFVYPEKGIPERSQRGSVVFLQPHNDFLWVFSETGMIGGLAFALLFIIGIGVAAIFLFKWNGTNTFTAAIYLALLTGVCLYTVDSSFDFPKERPLISFTFACILALTGVVSENKKIKPFSKSTTRIISTGLLALSFFTAWLWIIRIQGELNLKKAIAARQKGNFKGVKQYLEKINPTFFESDLTGTPIDWYKSELAYYQRDRVSFKKFSESSLKLNPYQLYNLYNLGTIYYKEGDNKTAIYYWEKAIQLAPRFTDAAVNLSAAYYNQKRYTEAAALLSKPEINYANESYGKITATVLGRYVYMISDSVSDAALKDALRQLAQNISGIRSLQQRMLHSGESPRDAALSTAKESIFN